VLTDSVLLMTLGAVLVLSQLVKTFMAKISLPAPVGYIALGLVLSTLNQQWTFIDSTFEYVFSVLAELGVVALLFRVGLRSHIHALVAKLPDASLIWVGDVVVNLAVGFGLAHYVIGTSVETALVVATAFSATSVAVSVSIWDELNLLRSVQGTLLIDVAELDDLSGVVLLTVLLAIVPVLQTGEAGLLMQAGTTALVTVLKLVVFVGLCYLFSRYVEEGFTQFNRRLSGNGTALVIAILGTGLVISAGAGLLGFSLAIGALFAGLAFSRDPSVVRNEGKFTFFYDFFAPFFFINIGIQVVPTAFVDAAGIGLLLFAVAAVAKLAGVGIPALLTQSRGDALALGLSMIPRAEIALLVVYQSSQLGGDVVSQEIFAGIVIASMMTSLAAPPIVRLLLIRQKAEKRA
jgi:Kef-type K+ transport system membrane component KefB